MRSPGGLVLIFASGLASSCLDTQLPTPPVLGPGTLRATVVSALPNRQELSPAKGATVTLVGTTLKATADDDGNVTLPGLMTTSGRLLFSFDADGDGVADRSRVITLEAVRAGFGKEVNLGQVILGRNATLVGVVKRGDRVGLNAGHGGIAVFLPQLPQLAYTGDDGSYVLGGVPEGNLVLSTFAQGYRSEATPIEVSAGLEVRVGTIVLEAAPGSAPIGTLSGRVQRSDGTPIPAVAVRAASRGVETVAQTNAEGRFTFEMLATGVFALSLEKSGLTPLRIDSVLVNAGQNEVGPYVMTDGAGMVSLDGGPPGAPDAGAGGGSGGGSTAGGSAGGGSAAGGSAGGGSAAGGSAAGGSAAGGSAAGGSAAGGSAAGGSAAGGSAAGGSAAGGSAAGGSAAGGSPAGGSAAGGAAGGSSALPIAVAGAPQIVTPGSMVTLNGMASTGDFPLRYSWTQTSGPMVTLTDNGTVTAHSPRFVAPAAGSVLEFALVVTDRLGQASVNAAVARVGCGSVPTARFTPDGGLVAGGQTLVFQSASFDDGGLVLVRHDWSATGSITSLVADGGPSAWVTFAPVAFMSPDELGSVELRVTNAIGATSGAFSRTFLIRGANPVNWSVDAGTGFTVVVGASPPLLTLNGSVTPPAATPAIAWSCAPPLGLLNANTLTPQFVAPVIAGPTQTFQCTMNASVMPPFAPPNQSGVVTFSLRDGADPFVVSHSVSAGRMSPFGAVLRLSEPIENVSNTPGGCTSALSYPPRLEAWGKNAILAPRSRLPIGELCGPFTGNLFDFASPPNSTTGTVLTAPTSVLVQPEWVGPWVSSGDYADPRPVIATMGPFPKEELQRWNPPLSLAPPFELLAREGGSLLRSQAFDPFAPDAGCGSACTLDLQAQALAGLTGDVAPAGHRVFFGGGSLWVSLEAGDGGVDGQLITQRTPGGSWQPATRATGSPYQVKDNWSQLRAAGGTLFIDTWAPDGGALVSTETVATGLPAITAASASRDYVVLATGPSRTLTLYRRSGLSWVNQTVTATTDVVRIATLESAPPNCAGCGPEIPYAVIERAVGAQLQIARVDNFPAVSTIVSAGVQGWAFAVRGGTQVVVAAINGDIRLLTAPVSNTSFADFNGPPRAGFPSPPAALDVNVTCEAAHPSLAFIEEALVITWQERCAPETRWRVAARVIR